MKRFSALILAVLLMLTTAACGEKRAPGETTEPFASAPEMATTQTPTRPLTEETEPIRTEPTQPQLPPQTEPTQPQLPPQPEPMDSDFVSVERYVPGILVELKYATPDNFTGQTVYDFQGCYLRYGTVKKLMTVQNLLAQQGLGLKIWDGFRPVRAQFALWEICPDPRYVANPETGFSSHSRGNTVDLTLVDREGQELTMPTGFDDFSSLADRNYADCTEEERNHATILELIMEKHGFSGYAGEWWHYSDTTSYPVEEQFAP